MNPSPLSPQAPSSQQQALGQFAQAMSADRSPLPSRVELQPDEVKNGLGQLVLTLVEFIRELLERQAIRRMDAGSLSEEEIERLGTTFMRLAEQIDELKEHFGLDEDDLNLDLGPLGKLL